MSRLLQHKILIAVLALGLLVAIVGIPRLMSDGDAGTSSTATATSSGTSAASTAMQQKAFRPVVVTGGGDRVITIEKAGQGAVILDAVHRGPGNFLVQSADESQLLINHVGSYKGSTLLDAAGGDTGRLKVTATGEWTLTIRPASTATAFDSAARGSGDAVLTYTGRKGKIAFTHSGHSIFFVLTHGTSTPRLVVNKKGNYQGKTKIGNGPILIQITTVGPWTARATAT